MRINFLCISLIALAVLVFYSQGLWVLLSGKDLISGQDLTLLFSAWDPDNRFYLKTYGGVAKPVSTTFAGLSYKLAGASTLPYALTARIVHCIVSICAFYLMCSLTRNTLLGLFSALLFASFYTFTEAILAPGAIDGVFLAFFGMLMLLSHVKYIETNGIKYLFAGAAFFVLALLSKESALVMPGLIILIDFYYRHGRLELRGMLRDFFSPEGVKKYGIYVGICILYMGVLLTGGEGHSLEHINSMNKGQGISRQLNILIYTIHYSITPTFIWNTLITKAFGLSFAVSMLILFYYSEPKVRNLLLFLACATTVLLLPSGLLDLQSRYLYFPAVFSMAFAATGIYYGVGKLFKSGLLDGISDIEQVKKRGLLIPLAFLLACYFAIMYSNYRFVSRQIIVAEKASTLIESNVREIRAHLDKVSGKYDLYLLNFPNAVWGDLPFAPIFVWGPEFNNRKAILNLYGAIGESAGNVRSLTIELGVSRRYGASSSSKISSNEFNALAKKKSNRMLLFDQTKEKVFDVSGEDYNSLQTLVSRPR